MKIEIEITKDGSHTFFVPELEEHYHSTNGAIQEADHIFMDAGLRQCNKRPVRIFEVGFGTGLNALLTLQEAEKNKIHMDYTTTERYPVQEEWIGKLNFPQLTGLHNREFFHELHDADWESRQQLTPHFSLLKIKTDITLLQFPPENETYDLIYFDAFAPEKQPEMWSEPIFRKLYDSCEKDAILVTYCAKGSIRRLLQSIGFKVERIPGPPGKREMIRARK